MARLIHAIDANEDGHVSISNRIVKETGKDKRIERLSEALGRVGQFEAIARELGENVITIPGFTFKRSVYPVYAAINDIARGSRPWSTAYQADEFLDRVEAAIRKVGAYLSMLKKGP